MSQGNQAVFILQCSECGRTEGQGKALVMCERQGCSPNNWGAPSTLSPLGRLEMIARETVQRCLNLLLFKNGEYAHDSDGLKQFRTLGTKLNLPMEAVLHVYFDKHLQAFEDYVAELREPAMKKIRLEAIRGRVDDMIVYLLIFQAMLDEREPKT